MYHTFIGVDTKSKLILIACPIQNFYFLEAMAQTDMQFNLGAKAKHERFFETGPNNNIKRSSAILEVNKSLGPLKITYIV